MREDEVLRSYIAVIERFHYYIRSIPSHSMPDFSAFGSEAIQLFYALAFPVDPIKYNNVVLDWTAFGTLKFEDWHPNAQGLFTVFVLRQIAVVHNSNAILERYQSPFASHG